MFGVVVNTFLTDEHPPSVELSVQFAVSLVLNCPEVSSVVLVDGSARPSDTLGRFCARLGVRYHHAGRPLAFAEAYNQGAASLGEEWIALMASDVYVLPGTFADFRRFIEADPGRPIGCLIPYLSQSDFPVQEGTAGRPRTACRVPAMTLNLNVFRREVFESMGGLSEAYSGNFNDLDLSLRLKEAGLDTFLVDAYAHHYGSLTLRYGTNTRFLQDAEVFFAAHPDLRAERGLWNVRFDRLLESRRLRVLYRAATVVPSDTVRSRLLPWVLDHVARYQRLR